MVNSAIVQLRPTRKGESISMYFVCCLCEAPVFWEDFMVSSMIVGLGLTLARIHLHVFWLFTLERKGIYGQLSSSGSETCKERGSHQHVFCCLCEACEFWDGFHGQLDNSMSGTDHGEKPTSSLFTLGGK